MTFPEIKFLSQAFEYVAEEGVSAHVRHELVRDYTTVDSDRNREFLYERVSYCSGASNGDYTLLREIPFGFASVSGA